VRRLEYEGAFVKQGDGSCRQRILSPILESRVSSGSCHGRKQRAPAAGCEGGEARNAVSRRRSRCLLVFISTSSRLWFQVQHELDSPLAIVDDQE